MLQALIGPVTGLLDKFIPDADEKARIAHGFAGAELPELPEFDMGTLLTVLGGMLGIGGLRTSEKQKGLTKWQELI